MKVNCPACGSTCEGDTEFTLELALLDHIHASPDNEHLNKLSSLIESIDRHISFAVMTARDDSDIRHSMYDKAARFDLRLRTIHLYAVTHATIAMQAARELFIDAGQEGKVTDHNNGKKLWRNLKEALMVAERK